MLVGPMREIVVIGDPHSADTAAALADLRDRFVPEYVLACRAGAARRLASPGPNLRRQETSAARATVFICQNFTCQAPVSGTEAAIAAWKKLGS